MNNKDDEFKISLTNDGFNITHNNKTIFYYGNNTYTDYMYRMEFYMEFYLESSMIKTKMLNTDYQINHIITKKLEKNLWFGSKDIYCDNIELNKNACITYNFSKTYIHITGHKNKDFLFINYIINNRYFDRLIYKYFDKYRPVMTHFKYTDYKIIIPNKYELLYYSKYFQVF